MITLITTHPHDLKFHNSITVTSQLMAKNPRRESTGALGPNIYDMTPFGRDQDFKCHTSSHMEEELMRRHEKNAIRGKKIARRVLHKCHVTISGFRPSGVWST
jgi:hypothetical protein